MKAKAKLKELELYLEERFRREHFDDWGAGYERATFDTIRKMKELDREGKSKTKGD